VQTQIPVVQLTAILHQLQADHHHHP